MSDQEYTKSHDWIQCDNPLQIRFETVTNKIVQYLFFKDNDFWAQGFRIMKRSERDFLVIPNRELFDPDALKNHLAEGMKQVFGSAQVYPELAADCDPQHTDHDWINWSIK